MGIRQFAAKNPANQVIALSVRSIRTTKRPGTVCRRGPWNKHPNGVSSTFWFLEVSNKRGGERIGRGSKYNVLYQVCVAGR